MKITIDQINYLDKFRLKFGTGLINEINDNHNRPITRQKKITPHVVDEYLKLFNSKQLDAKKQELLGKPLTQSTPATTINTTTIQHIPAAEYKEPGITGHEEIRPSARERSTRLSAIPIKRPSKRGSTRPSTRRSRRHGSEVLVLNEARLSDSSGEPIARRMSRKRGSAPGLRGRLSGVPTSDAVSGIRKQHGFSRLSAHPSGPAERLSRIGEIEDDNWTTASESGSAESRRSASDFPVNEVSRESRRVTVMQDAGPAASESDSSNTGAIDDFHRQNVDQLIDPDHDYVLDEDKKNLYKKIQYYARNNELDLFKLPILSITELLDPHINSSVFKTYRDILSYMIYKKEFDNLSQDEVTDIMTYIRKPEENYGKFDVIVRAIDQYNKWVSNRVPSQTGQPGRTSLRGVRDRSSVNLESRPRADYISSDEAVARQITERDPYDPHGDLSLEPNERHYFNKIQEYLEEHKKPKNTKLNIDDIFTLTTNGTITSQQEQNKNEYISLGKYFLGEDNPEHTDSDIIKWLFWITNKYNKWIRKRHAIAATLSASEPGHRNSEAAARDPYDPDGDPNLTPQLRRAYSNIQATLIKNGYQANTIFPAMTVADIDKQIQAGHLIEDNKNNIIGKNIAFAVTFGLTKEEDIANLFESKNFKKLYEIADIVIPYIKGYNEWISTRVASQRGYSYQKSQRRVSSRAQAPSRLRDSLRASKQASHGLNDDRRKLLIELLTEKQVIATSPTIVQETDLNYSNAVIQWAILDNPANHEWGDPSYNIKFYVIYFNNQFYIFFNTPNDKKDETIYNSSDLHQTLGAALPNTVSELSQQIGSSEIKSASTELIERLGLQPALPSGQSTLRNSNVASEILATDSQPQNSFDNIVSSFDINNPFKSVYYLTPKGSKISFSIFNKNSSDDYLLMSDSVGINSQTGNFFLSLNNKNPNINSVNYSIARYLRLHLTGPQYQSLEAAIASDSKKWNLQLTNPHVEIQFPGTWHNKESAPPRPPPRPKTFGVKYQEAAPVSQEGTTYYCIPNPMNPNSLIEFVLKVEHSDDGNTYKLESKYGLKGKTRDMFLQYMKEYPQEYRESKDKQLSNGETALILVISLTQDKYNKFESILNMNTMWELSTSSGGTVTFGLWYSSKQNLDNGKLDLNTPFYHIAYFTSDMTYILKFDIFRRGNRCLVRPISHGVSANSHDGHFFLALKKDSLKEQITVIEKDGRVSLQLILYKNEFDSLITAITSTSKRWILHLKRLKEGNQDVVFPGFWYNDKPGELYNIVDHVKHLIGSINMYFKKIDNLFIEIKKEDDALSSLKGKEEKHKQKSRFGKIFSSSKTTEIKSTEQKIQQYKDSIREHLDSIRSLLRSSNQTHNYLPQSYIERGMRKLLILERRLNLTATALISSTPVASLSPAPQSSLAPAAPQVGMKASMASSQLTNPPPQPIPVDQLFDEFIERNHETIYNLNAINAAINEYNKKPQNLQAVISQIGKNFNIIYGLINRCNEIAQNFQNTVLHPEMLQTLRDTTTFYQEVEQKYNETLKDKSGKPPPPVPDLLSMLLQPPAGAAAVASEAQSSQILPGQSMRANLRSSAPGEAEIRGLVLPDLPQQSPVAAAAIRASAAAQPVDVFSRTSIAASPTEKAVQSSPIFSGQGGVRAIQQSSAQPSAPAAAIKNKLDLPDLPPLPHQTLPTGRPKQYRSALVTQEIPIGVMDTINQLKSDILKNFNLINYHLNRGDLTSAEIDIQRNATLLQDLRVLIDTYNSYDGIQDIQYFYISTIETLNKYIQQVLYNRELQSKAPAAAAEPIEIHSTNVSPAVSLAVSRQGLASDLVSPMAASLHASQRQSRSSSSASAAAAVSNSDRPMLKSQSSDNLPPSGPTTPPHFRKVTAKRPLQGQPWSSFIPTTTKHQEMSSRAAAAQKKFPPDEDVNSLKIEFQRQVDNISYSSRFLRSLLINNTAINEHDKKVNIEKHEKQIENSTRNAIDIQKKLANRGIIVNLPIPPPPAPPSTRKGSSDGSFSDYKSQVQGSAAAQGARAASPTVGSSQSGVRGGQQYEEFVFDFNTDVIDANKRIFISDQYNDPSNPDNKQILDLKHSIETNLIPGAENLKKAIDVAIQKYESATGEVVNYTINPPGHARGAIIYYLPKNLRNTENGQELFETLTQLRGNLNNYIIEIERNRREIQISMGAEAVGGGGSYRRSHLAKHKNKNKTKHKHNYNHKARTGRKNKKTIKKYRGMSRMHVMPRMQKQNVAVYRKYKKTTRKYKPTRHVKMNKNKPKNSNKKSRKIRR
jgi:hypothetical protein